MFLNHDNVTKYRKQYEKQVKNIFRNAPSRREI